MTPIPAASVIIATYDRPHLLLRALESLAAQTNAPAFEVLVVENGSDVAAPLRSRFPDFRFFRSESRGIAAARNYGLRQARGRIAIFTDNDIVVDPGFIAAHVRAHADSGRPKVAVGWLDFAASDARSSWPGLRYEADAENQLHRRTLENGNEWWFFAGFFSVPREFLLDIGGFGEQFEPYGGDEIDLLVRLRERNAEILFDRTVRGLHLFEEGRASFIGRMRLRGRCAILLFKEHGHACPDFEMQTFFRGYTAWKTICFRLAFQHSRWMVRAAQACTAALDKPVPFLRRLDYALTLQGAYWTGVHETIGWDELARLVKCIPPQPLEFRPAVPVPEDHWDQHSAAQDVIDNQPKIRQVLQWVGSGSVLDLGCHDGGIASRIAGQGARVVGADRLRYLKMARKRYGVPVVAIDANQTLPFADRTFDTVLISGLLEYVADPLRLLSEASRVCKGRLVLVAPNANSLKSRYRKWRGLPRTPEARFSLGELRAALDQAGFSIVEFRRCPYRQRRPFRRKIGYVVETLFPALASDFAFLCELRHAAPSARAGLPPTVSGFSSNHLRDESPPEKQSSCAAS